MMTSQELIVSGLVIGLCIALHPATLILSLFQNRHGERNCDPMVPYQYHLHCCCCHTIGLQLEVNVPYF